MEITDKNIYLYIAKLADDRTVLNMFSVNKQFNSPEFFEMIMEQRYPLLIPFKKKSESWRWFYSRMFYYIEKLQKDFGISYISTSGDDPKELYMFQWCCFDWSVPSEWDKDI